MSILMIMYILFFRGPEHHPDGHEHEWTCQTSTKKSQGAKIKQEVRDFGLKQPFLAGSRFHNKYNIFKGVLAETEQEVSFLLGRSHMR